MQQLSPLQHEKPIVSIENVEKRYGKFTALYKMNLEIKSGEHLLILGPNGAGKTTLYQGDNGDTELQGNDQLTVST